MNKLLIAVTGMVLVVGTALAAEPAQQQGTETPPATYYWLHPKLGMVKVERATGFMVVSRKQRAREDQQQPKSGHDHSRVHKLM